MTQLIKVAITGACSTLARSVVSLLDADQRVESILALDIRPYHGVPSAKIRYQKIDVRDLNGLHSAFADIEAVVHLAFIVIADVLDMPTIYAVNIDGSKNVVRAAAEAGVKKLIYTSAIGAYGMVPGNPPLLTEDMPIRGEQNRKNYYFYTKAVVEKFMDDFANTHPQLTITRYRSHLITGPNFLRHSGNLFVVPNLTKPGKSYWGFRPEGPNGSLLQYTHEQDLAKAIQYALHNPMPGAYNIAAEPLDLEGCLRDRGKKYRKIPWRAVYGLVSILCPLSARMRLAKSWLIGAKYRNIMDCSKLKQAGFDEPLHTTLDCVQEANAYFGQRHGHDSKKTNSWKVINEILKI